MKLSIVSHEIHLSLSLRYPFECNERDRNLLLPSFNILQLAVGTEGFTRWLGLSNRSFELSKLEGPLSTS